MSVLACRPWRSVWLPRAVTAAVLVAGLPLFLRMPLWCDLTLYDLAAKNLLAGGVHYRDVFDTNFPGFVWLLTGIRWVLGFGAFPLRCVDLAVVAGVVLLVDRLARRGGATPWSRWWAVAGAAALYMGSAEMVHCQRDVWMTVPAAAAVLLRVRRVNEDAAAASGLFGRAALEGALWGVAVWIKPHCALMALGVWVVTARRVAATCRSPWRGLAADLGGNLVGGGLVGAAGLAWVVGSGSWPGFREVITVWAPEYNELSRYEYEERKSQELHWFPPWSLWLLPTVPLAVLSVLDGVPWRGRPAGDPGPVGRVLPAWLWDRGAGADPRLVRAALGALYLVWAYQAFVIQRGFSYVHLPELFLMFGLWAAHRWAMPAVVLAWLAVTSAAWLVGDACPPVRESLLRVARHDGRPAERPDDERYVVRYPLADADRLRLWPECWRVGLTDRGRYALWDGLERLRDHEATTRWGELAEVADFLRSRGVEDGELLAWHDSPHALYLMLGVKPGIRYLHLNTIQAIGFDAYERVQAELAAAAGTARFAVGDLEYPALGETVAERRQTLGPPADPPGDLLPAGLHPFFRVQFPFNQRAVFRSRGGLGRYTVHELKPPLADWTLPTLGTGRFAP